jgi:hypothetical protein
MQRPRDPQAPATASAASSRLSWLALGLAAIAAACPGCAETELQRPDVVLITMAALPVERLSCHGGADDLGRDLCSVADEGSRYVWAFAAAGSPVPAVATILTGLPPDVHGVVASAASFLRNDATTIAEQLEHAGYATAAFVGDASLNRSRHLDQGFERFDDGVIDGQARAGPDAGVVGRAAQWLAAAPSPFLAWVHVDAGDATQTGDPAEALRGLDRDVSRLLAVLDARQSPPAILVTSVPPVEAGRSLSPAETRVALLWRPPRVGGGRGISRVIRTPVSQLDIAPTLLRATGLVDPAGVLPGHPLPFRERRAGEAGRTLEIKGEGRQALVGEGVYVVVGDDGDALGVAQLPLAGERVPELARADDSEELLSRLWAAPDPP